MSDSVDAQREEFEFWAKRKDCPVKLNLMYNPGEYYHVETKEALRIWQEARAPLLDRLLVAEKIEEDYADEINRLRNVIQSACIGGADEMLARWVELFPDAPVPTILFKSQSVATVLMHEGEKIIDGSMEFMDTATIGTELYTSPPPSTAQVDAMRLALGALDTCCVFGSHGDDGYWREGQRFDATRVDEAKDELEQALRAAIGEIVVCQHCGKNLPDGCNSELQGDPSCEGYQTKKQAAKEKSNA